MGVSGPRLDRPSAIGDEGRPRATSLWAGTIAVIGLTTAVGITIGEPSLALGLGTVAGMAVAGIGLLESDGRNAVELFVGYALVATFGSAAALFVVTAPVITEAGVAISGLTIALLGIGASWANSGATGFRRSGMGVLILYVSMILTLVFGAVVIVAIAASWGVITAFANQSLPVFSLIGFVSIVSGTAAAVLVALRLLPLVELTRRDRRPALRDRLTRLRKLLYGLLLATPAVLIVVAVLALTGWVDLDVDPESGLGIVLTAFSSWLVFGPPLAIAVGSLVSGVLAFALRWVTKDRSDEAVRRTMAIAVGVFVAVLGLGVWQLTSIPYAFVTGVSALAPIVLVTALACVIVGIWATVVPARASGPATAATGLVIAAIGLGWGHPVLVFACIAGAVFVWDVSTFGLGVTGELGHIPETRRLELFHSVVGAGVAVAAVTIVVILETLRSDAAAGGGSTAVALLILAAIVFLLPLRG